MSLKLTPEKIAELRAKASALRESAHKTLESVNHGTVLPLSEHGGSDSSGTTTEISGAVSSAINPINQRISEIILNQEQLRAVGLATEGKPFVLTGAAGTGKTTCTKQAIESIIRHCSKVPLAANGHKWLTDGVPGIICTAYTRRAVQNIRKVMPPDIASNCITIHKLLAYQPVYYEVLDEETGDTRKTMRFEPTYNRFNPLPDTIHTIIIDEASMLSVELYETLMDACPHRPTVIFIGDIQQLPPVFGSAILGYKLLELPVVELTHVYRQALESPIIRLAHRILSGKPVPVDEYNDWYESGKLKIHPWKKKISADNATLTAAKFLTEAIKHGAYDPDEDIVLCPFNKAFGTIELNNHIANYLGLQRNAVVYEIICGFEKKYLAVGDRVLYDKEDAVITAIEYNSIYGGKMPQSESKTLDRWGCEQGTEHHVREQTADEIDSMLDSMIAGGEDKEGRKKSCSHKITLLMSNTDEEIIIDKVGEVSSLDLGYALTVHKSQGSEWRKVFFLTHQSHATMLQRELIYTAVTRAREELYWICEADTLTKAIKSQRIVGDTIEAKAEYFKGKVDRNEKQTKMEFI